MRSTLETLRARIRWYVGVEGAVAGAAWLGIAFWASLGIDWFFEPPTAVRWLLLAAILVVFGGILYVMIGRRAFVQFQDRHLAMLLERRFPMLDESLLTAVELATHADRDDECSLPMLDQTAREAAQRIGQVRSWEVFKLGRLWRGVGKALFLIAAIVVFGLFRPDALATWTRRCVLGSAEIWPRHIVLTVEAVQDGVTRNFSNGVLRVAKGSDLEIVAHAKTESPWQVPKICQVRYRAQDGSHRHSMTGVGQEDLQQREYTYMFRNLAGPIELDVVGGDAAQRGLRIEVVENPAIAQMEIECEYPKYTSRSPQRLTVTGAMQLPIGSRISVYATTNKDMTLVQIELAAGDQFLAPATIHFADAADRRKFHYTLDRLDRDTTLLFTLLDTDEVRTREPVRLSLGAVQDEPPRLTVQLQGIGSAITAKARLPFAGSVSDDYGIAKIWFDYELESKAGKQPIADLAARGTTVTDYKLDQAVDVQPLGLAAGKKLSAALKAADFYDLGKTKEPNVGTSERWVWDIVTPEQLRAILEARELVLRQRFESIIQEVTETRDLLVRIDFVVPPPKKAGKGADAAKRPADTEPDDDAGRSSELTPERFHAMQTLRVERSLQDAQKNAHETLGVAESFDDIRQQLVNNRIDTEELIQRLKGGIADPLRTIGEQLFPELEHRLEQLRAVLADEKLGPGRRDLARKQVDEILNAMQQVLERMMELENFNEAVELLRTIVDMQEKLNEQTKEQHKRKLHDLLKE